MATVNPEGLLITSRGLGEVADTIEDAAPVVQNAGNDDVLRAEPEL